MIHIRYTHLTQFSQPTWLSNEPPARSVYCVSQSIESNHKNVRLLNSQTKLSMSNSFHECLHPDHYYNGSDLTSLPAVMELDISKHFLVSGLFTSERRVPLSADNKRL